MTLRHRVTATFVAAAIALGCAALPAQVSAERVAVEPSAEIGNDTLAGHAALALEALDSYQATGDVDSLDEYRTIRDAVATDAAFRLGLDAASMRVSWSTADSNHQVALLAAFTQLGTKYRRNASTPGVAFDCSGLTSWAWGQAGTQLFRQSRTQIRSSEPVTRETAQAGDLVYYPGHVMMYLGVDNAIIHAPFTGRNIELGFVSKRKADSALYGDPAG